MSPDFVDKLNDIIADLYGGWHFYTHAAIVVEGHERLSLQQGFRNFAAANTLHIAQLGDLLLFVGGFPTTKVNGWRSDVTDLRQIVEHASTKEQALQIKIGEVIATPYHMRFHALSDCLISRIVHLHRLIGRS